MLNDLKAQLKDRFAKWELTHGQFESVPVHFNAGKLSSIKDREYFHFATRAFKDGRIGFADTNDTKNLDQFTSNLDRSIENGQNAEFNFALTPPQSTIRTYDENVFFMGKGEIVDIGKTIVDKIHRVYPDIVVNVTLVKSVGEIFIENSNGLTLAEEKSNFTISIVLEKVTDDDILYISDERDSASIDVDYNQMVDGLLDKVKHTERVVSLKSKTIPVIFAEYGTHVLFMPLTMGLNGKNVLLKTSPLADKLGTEIFDQKFSLIDCGKMDFTTSSRNFDDEGTQRRDTILIENGMLRNFIYDQHTGSLAGKESTGSCFRGDIKYWDGSTLPQVKKGIWNVTRGDTSFNDLIKSLDSGLIVYDVLGLGQGNVMAGEFSLNVSLGFVVEHGEIVGRAKNVMIAGNVYDSLKKIDCITNTLPWDKDSLNCPPIVVSNVNLTI